MNWLQPTITYRRRWFRTPRWEAHYRNEHAWAMGWGDTRREAFDMLSAKLQRSRCEISPPDEQP